ncbi:DUF3150 domain-containing protein [Desulfoscipio geothermicus]|uniref:Uncharacterized protein n=1 Tax=Desulfoscipio geothermicus DSM 3669 TaxID=1121426 RepID=A0A1I6E3U2_9FIRM|nr:DUF3150 domain-containing protein [Desulfoscipio geothermicus]SFR12444.1 Protein of unknown function [Desulfoscipio geothermicus DSM 3669]
MPGQNNDSQKKKAQAKEAINELLENIKLTECEEEDIEKQRAEVASRLGVHSDDVEMRIDVTATKLAREGVLMELHIARERFEKQLSAEDLGLDADSAEYKDFLTQYINLGRKRLIPASYLRKLSALEIRARRLLRGHSFQTAWGHFVPYKVYDEVKKGLTEIEREYRKVYDEILDRYDSIRFSTYVEYRKAAVEVYRTLKKDPDCPVPEDFIDTFASRIMNHFPRKEEIADSYRFKVNLSFIPVTSTMLEMDAHMAMTRVKLETQQEIVYQVKQTYQRQVKGFISDLAVHLRTMIFEAVSAAQENLEKHGNLPGPSVRSLRLIVEKVKELNFMNDRQVLQHVEQLNEMLESSASDRETGDIAGLLQKIAEDNRRVILALGHEPRLSRNKGEIVNDLKEIKQSSVNRRARRGSYNEQSEEPGKPVNRRQRGVIEKTVSII